MYLAPNHTGRGANIWPQEWVVMFFCSVVLFLRFGCEVSLVSTMCIVMRVPLMVSCTRRGSKYELNPLKQ